MPVTTPNFITSTSDTHAFLAWLGASFPGGLSAQLKGEKLIVVPLTPNEFRSSVSALQSLDGKEGVNFHNFSLPEDCCFRLLVKKLSRGMPERFVREEIQSLNICVQGVMQFRNDRRDQDLTKDTPLIVSVARGPEKSKVRSLTEICGLRMSVELHLTP